MTRRRLSGAEDSSKKGVLPDERFGSGRLDPGHLLSAGRQTLLATVTEAVWREQVVKWAYARRWLVYWTWSSLHSPRGFPDLILCRPPRLETVELKTVTGRLMPDQQIWDDALSGINFYKHHGVWRPTDEDLVLSTLE